MDNANPTVHRLAATSATAEVVDPLQASAWLNSASSYNKDSMLDSDDSSDSDEEPIDADEIYDLIRGITDPEHPLTLEQLAVVSPEQITVTHGPKPRIVILFTPTVPHCSMATLIGLSIRVRMLRSLPERFKVDIRVREGSHASENAVNRQLNDKERVAAALENSHLLGVVQNCLATAASRGQPVER